MKLVEPIEVMKRKNEILIMNKPKEGGGEQLTVEDI